VIGVVVARRRALRRLLLLMLLQAVVQHQVMVAAQLAAVRAGRIENGGQSSSVVPRRKGLLHVRHLNDAGLHRFQLLHRPANGRREENRRLNRLRQTTILHPARPRRPQTAVDESRLHFSGVLVPAGGAHERSHSRSSVRGKVVSFPPQRVLTITPLWRTKT